VGARSRKRRREGQPRLRGEAANEAVRAQLEPLAPGERPGAVTVAAGLAVAFGLANLILLASGWEIGGNKNANASGAILFAVIMFVAAWGMWTGRYWAVLGFECLLGIVCVSAALALLVASNLWAVVTCVVVLGLAGTLFYKLIRAMARMQMPGRPGARTG
jgi:hypothetical protein